MQALVLLVGIDVGQFRQGAECLADLRFPGAQQVQVVGLQCVLVLGVAGAAANPDILHRLHEQVGAGNVAELAAQACNHLVCRELAFRQRLESDEHVAAIALAAAGEGDHAQHVGVLANNIHKLIQLDLHRLE